MAKYIFIYPRNKKGRNDMQVNSQCLVLDTTLYRSKSTQKNLIESLASVISKASQIHNCLDYCHKQWNVKHKNNDSLTIKSNTLKKCQNECLNYQKLVMQLKNHTLEINSALK